MRWVGPYVPHFNIVEEKMVTADFNAYLEQNKQRFLEELKDFCRQPSIAAQNVGMKEMADMVVDRLRRLGADVRLIPVQGGPPVVYGEIGSGPRTLMIYNHYDVQPPEPLELWVDPPFSPTIRDGNLYARGVADNKGNLLCRIQAIEAWLAVRGPLPLKIKFVIEGEEEIGSIHLPQFVQENKGMLAADGCLWEFGDKDASERVCIYLGLKGIYYVELRARGASRDLHSSRAAIVPNPAWRLVWALSTLKDKNDRILIKGFMEQVVPPTRREMRLLRDIPLDEDKVLKDLQIPHFIRKLRGTALKKKFLFEPTCTICGIQSGYVGEGSKTVLPNYAFAKVDFRLVPNLTPEIAHRLLRRHLDRHGFTDIEIVDLGSEHPAKSDLDAPIVGAAIAAARDVYQQEPVVYPLSAGSGPMYSLCQALGIPTVSAGVGHARSDAHAPNENIRLADYWEGIHYIASLIERFART